MARRFGELHDPLLSDPAQTVDLGFIRALVDEATRLLDWPVRLDRTVQAVVLSKAMQDDEGRVRDHRLEPVNGFFLEQLAEAEAAVRAGAIVWPGAGPAAAGDPAARSDCLDPGRWPTRCGPNGCRPGAGRARSRSR